jgi:hypothetical protein
MIDVNKQPSFAQQMFPNVQILIVRYYCVCPRVIENLSNPGGRPGRIEKNKYFRRLQCTEYRDDRRRLMFHQYGNGGILQGALLQEKASQAISRPVEIIISEPDTSGLDRDFMRIVTYLFFKPIDNGLVNFMP